MSEEKILRRVVIAANTEEQANIIDEIDVIRINKRKKEKDPNVLETLANRKEFILDILAKYAESNKKWLNTL